MKKKMAPIGRYFKNVTKEKITTSKALRGLSLIRATGRGLERLTGGGGGGGGEVG